MVLKYSFNWWSFTFLGNHISWIDWAIVLMATPREVKFVMDKEIYNKWF